jgi:peptidyl-prolyl cis-trans isomerase D
MLLELRKVTRGAFASIVLGLIGLAMVLFLIPRQGIPNPFAGAYLAKVGDTEITANDLNRAIDSLVMRGHANGRNFTKEDIVEQGAHLQILDDLISQASMENYARHKGVRASDAQVAMRIRSFPGLTDPVTHAFEPQSYAGFLANNHYTSQEFEQEERREVTVEMMMHALSDGVRIPSSFGAMAVTIHTESRTASVAQAPLSIVGDIAPPTEAQLQNYYTENKERLQLPEFRQLTLVFARKADFAARANITEDQIRQEFNNRAPRLGSPEKRSSVRIAVQTQAQGNDVVARINAGQSPDAVAAATHLQAVHGTDETHDAVTDGRVADALFAMPANSPARLVQGQLSWVVVKPLAVTPGVTVQYSAYHDQIKNELQTAAANQLIDAAINSFEETRAAGSSVVQAAQTGGLSVVAVPAVEEHGIDLQRQPVPALSGQTELLRTAFHTAGGEASDFIQVADGEALVSVEHITPPHAPPLAEIRDQVSTMWRNGEVGRRLLQISDELAQAVQRGQDFASAARAHHLQVVMTSVRINQDNAGRIPARQLVGQIFGARQNAVVSDQCVQRPAQPLGGLCAHGDEFLIAHLESINHLDPATAPQLVQQARASVQQEIESSFAEALAQQITVDAHPTKSQEQITRAYPPNNASGNSGDEGQ